MTITELIDHLNDQLDAYGDIEVRIAYQPNWPISATVGNVRTLDKEGETHEEHESDFDPKFCWIATGHVPHSESGYAPDSAWDPIW